MPKCFGAIGPVSYGHLIGNIQHLGKFVRRVSHRRGGDDCPRSVEIILGVDAAQKSLEDVAAPLWAVRAETRTA